LQSPKIAFTQVKYHTIIKHSVWQRSGHRKNSVVRKKRYEHNPILDALNFTTITFSTLSTLLPKCRLQFYTMFCYFCRTIWCNGPTRLINVTSSIRRNICAYKHVCLYWVFTMYKYITYHSPLIPKEKQRHLKWCSGPTRVINGTSSIRRNICVYKHVCLYWEFTINMYSRDISKFL
jgi:hypothetical protein